MSKYLSKVAILGALACVFATDQTLAFGTFGHRTIAEIAEHGLTPGARAQLVELLKVAPRPSLVDLSTWPDELRDDPASQEQGKLTARWHYMNFPKGDCNVSIALACPDGNCLVPRLNEQIALLGNRKLTLTQRAEALGFVVHLFGDLHQPLHIGYAFDKGGNDFQISLGANAAPVIAPVPPPGVQAQRMGANLHSLWDSLIFNVPKLGLPAEAAQISALTVPNDAVGEINVETIARESCKIVQASDFYPEKHLISDAYLSQTRPRAQLRVALAGQRLAKLLNQTLVNQALVNQTLDGHDPVPGKQ